MLVVQQFWVLRGPFGEDGGFVRAAVAEADELISVPHALLSSR